MLWHCEATQKLLQTVKDWLNSYNINIPFVEEHFIFNIGSLFSEADLLFILELKFYIFYTKRLNSTLSIVAFKNRIINTYLSLKYIANKNNKLVKFEIDWNKYKNLFIR